MPRRRRSLPVRLLVAGVVGTAVGAGAVAALMAYLLRGPVTLSRAERDAIARARGTAADTAPLAAVATPSGGPPSAAPAPEPVDSAPADSAMGIAPPVIGLTEEAARTLILAAGFTIGTVASAGSDRPAGEVIATFPEPGERVPLPAAINLILSTGSAPRPDSATPPDTVVNRSR